MICPFRLQVTECVDAMQVFEAAVIGKPHKKWVERPLLVIVPAPGRKPSKQSILGFLKVWLDPILMLCEMSGI